MSDCRFRIPAFQREYSWQESEVENLWNDLISSVKEPNYFLGLVILTDIGKEMNVIDGQQRLVTITLLAKTLHNKAAELGQVDLATQIDMTFLRKVTNSATQEKVLRISFMDENDDDTFKAILNGDSASVDGLSKEMKSSTMIKSFTHLSKNLDKYLKGDEVDKLGSLTDFLKDNVFFAVFVHPNDSAAYRIFEVVNTRGRELTTADLLKNYVLSEASDQKEREKYYAEWQRLSKDFSSGSGNNTFVQYIRHVVTVKCGNIPGKDLYDVLSGNKKTERYQPSSSRLLGMLSARLELYSQIVDPSLYSQTGDSSLSGPAEKRELEIFDAFKSLGVVQVRPILLALSDLDDGVSGMEFLLRLIVRVMVVESIGTGKVEAALGDAARRLSEEGNPGKLPSYLASLNPTKEQFVSQLTDRSLPKRTLTFVRRSMLQKKTTPEKLGTLHWIIPEYPGWGGLNENDSDLVTTFGNSILASASSRPKRASESWDAFKDSLLNLALDNEIAAQLKQCANWDAATIKRMGQMAAERAANIWY